MPGRSGGKSLRVRDDKGLFNRSIKASKSRRKKTKVNFGRRLTVISENNIHALMQYVEILDGVEIDLYASGEYPEKKRIPVQNVAKWQNDGTSRGIKPAQFVERAARKARFWQGPIFKGVADIFNNASTYQLEQAMLKASYDIDMAVNRIRTGRLKKSFSYKYIVMKKTSYRPLPSAYAK